MGTNYLFGFNISFIFLSMKISIITATYNSAAHIASCIESVNSQTYPNIEHIIIDGASNDNTIEIIKDIPNRVAKIISEPDNGIYDALNKGIQYSSGELIAFLHADDEFATPQTIANVVEQFGNDDVSGVYGNLIFVNKENKVIRKWESGIFNPSMVKKGWMPPHPTLVLHKTVYHRYGLFNPSFRIAGDYDFMLRIMLAKDIYLKYIPEIITRMRIGGTSTGSIKGIICKSREDIKAMKNNGFKYPFYSLLAKNFLKLPQLFKK